jgi:hypothetical protein
MPKWKQGAHALLLAVLCLSAFAQQSQMVVTGISDENPTTVAKLPAAGNYNGTTLWVTDSTTATSGGTVAGGGTIVAPVKSNGTNWIVQTVGGTSGGTAPYSQAFTAQTSVTLNHNLNTKNVIVACYDNQSANQQLGATIAITSVNAVTVSFLAAQTGYCVANGGIGPAGPSGSSVPKYHFTLSSSLSYTITGSTHGLGTADVAVVCLDAATPSNSFVPTYTVDRSTFDVVVTLLAAKSGGSCFIR